MDLWNPRAAARAEPARSQDHALPQEIDSSDGEGPRRDAALPYGFWRLFIEKDMESQYTNRLRMQLKRALGFYVLRKKAGANTLSAMRGMRPRYSCRSDGGALKKLEKQVLKTVQVQECNNSSTILFNY